MKMELIHVLQGFELIHFRRLPPHPPPRKFKKPPQCLPKKLKQFCVLLRAFLAILQRGNHVMHINGRHKSHMHAARAQMARAKFERFWVIFIRSFNMSTPFNTLYTNGSVP